MARLPGPGTAWIVNNVGCPKCHASIGNGCISASGSHAGGPHGDRRQAALEAGFSPPTAASTVLLDRRKRVDEAEVMALGDKLLFAFKIAGEGNAFFTGLARILIELGYKP